jgi:glycosyltransferase involved in cell wall biosynthesis
MIGHIKPAKDYPLALEAPRRWCAGPRWRVLFLGEALTARGYVAGRDSDTEYYKRAVMEQYDALGIADQVLFAGARADAPAILAQCDVQLMTSCREGFPNVVLEGMVPRRAGGEHRLLRHPLILPRAAGRRQPRARGLARAILAATRPRRDRRRTETLGARARQHRARRPRLEGVYERYLRRDARAAAA